MRATRGVGAGVLLAVLAVAAPTTPARAEVTCAPPAAPGPQPAGVPWPQARYDLHRLAGIADGGGVTVAVVDSGVDATHPQLAGAVARGEDFLTPGGTRPRDRAGPRTPGARLIAAP